MKVKPLFLIVWIALFAACDDGLEFDPDDYDTKLVVDGWIENGSYPVVALTKSASYFSTIDSAAIRNLVATHAKVTVSDGDKGEILTLVKNERFFPPYVYQGTEIRGETGKTYFLTVELEGQKYEAETTIPAPVEIDSLWFELAEDSDSLGLIYGEFTDNGDEENFYRLFTRRMQTDQRFIPVYLSAIGDQYFNGQSFTFSLFRGAESLTDLQDDMYFRKGDTVLVKISAIDRAHFDFWRTLERELYVVGNPFSSSGNEIKSNVPGALGVWGGYASTVYQIIAR